MSPPKNAQLTVAGMISCPDSNPKANSLDSSIHCFFHISNFTVSMSKNSDMVPHKTYCKQYRMTDLLWMWRGSNYSILAAQILIFTVRKPGLKIIGKI